MKVLSYIPLRMRFAIAAVTLMLSAYALFQASQQASIWAYACTDWSIVCVGAAVLAALSVRWPEVWAPVAKTAGRVWAWIPWSRVFAVGAVQVTIAGMILSNSVHAIAGYFAHDLKETDWGGWDTLWYHLPYGRHILAGHLDYWTNAKYPGLSDYFYTYEVGAVAIHNALRIGQTGYFVLPLITWCLLAVGVYTLARLRTSPATAVLLAAIATSMPYLLTETHGLSVDLPLTAAVVWSVAAIERSRMNLAAICVGILCSIRVTGVLYGILFMIAYRKEILSAFPKPWAVAIGTAVGGFWFARNIVVFHSLTLPHGDLWGTTLVANTGHWCAVTKVVADGCQQHIGYLACALTLAALILCDWRHSLILAVMVLMYLTSPFSATIMDHLIVQSCNIRYAMPLFALGIAWYPPCILHFRDLSQVRTTC